MAEFAAYNSDIGKFRRYCRSHVFQARFRLMAMLLTLPIAILFLGAGQQVLLLTVLFIFGEFFDLSIVKFLSKRPMNHSNIGRFRVWTTLSAMIQVCCSATVIYTLIVASGWKMVPFGIILCLGAGLDSALVYYLHRSAAMLRIVAFSAVPFLAYPIVAPPSFNTDFIWLISAATFIFTLYVLHLIVRQLGISRSKRDASQNDLLIRSIELSEMNVALQSFRHQTRRLALVAEQANDSVIISDGSGIILWVNKAFTTFTGYSSAEAVGRNVSFLNDPSGDLGPQRRLSAARQNGLPAREELKLVRKDGTEFWVEVSMTPLIDPETKEINFIGVERDITSVKQREQMLAQARLDAEEAARAKDTFLATMSHEIRTPMNGILATADLFRGTKLDEEQTVFLDTITSSGESLMTIINDVLDFSKLQAGKLQIVVEPFSIRDCVNSVVQLLRPLALAKGLTLTTEWSSDCPTGLLGDTGRIRQILLNLVGNAIKFTDEGGVRIVVDTSADDDICTVSLRVIDSGIGIPSNRIAGVFETFAQGDATITRTYGGTGLGLSISRHLAEALGGMIHVASVEGEGTTFTLEIPLRLGERDIVQTDPDGYLEEVLHGSEGLRILVAEDNRTNRMLLKKMLAPYPMDLCFAVDGGEVVEAFEQLNPDLVLMDVSMPVIDGLEATRRIRAFEAQTRHPPTPIIALTANAFAEDRDKCLAAGMTGFLTKPFRRSTLLRELMAQTARVRRQGDSSAQPQPGSNVA